jgi:hypothetical protein
VGGRAAIKRIIHHATLLHNNMISVLFPPSRSRPGVASPSSRDQTKTLTSQGRSHLIYLPQNPLRWMFMYVCEVCTYVCMCVCVRLQMGSQVLIQIQSPPRKSKPGNFDAEDSNQKCLGKGVRGQAYNQWQEYM